ncbi:putative fimbrial chaperone protein ElfD precursor [compost metagenome]
MALLGAPLAGWSAGFGINATRLIYPEGASSINVAVRNTLNHEPYLVQTAISGKQDAQTAAPFTVTPPLFRLEPQSTNQLRIAFTGQPLPDDRESVFYLHATAIPASTQRDPAQQRNDVQAQLRFGVGNIIKLFYRPASLSGSSAAAQKELPVLPRGWGAEGDQSLSLFCQPGRPEGGEATTALGHAGCTHDPPFRQPYLAG